MKNNQHGFVGNAIIIAAAAIGSVTLVVQNKNQSLKQQMTVIEQDREREMIRYAALNAAARYKSLLAEKKTDDGSYIPGIYAQDYFSFNWVIKPSEEIKDKDKKFSFSQGETSIKSIASPKNELQRATRIFDGSSSFSQSQENFSLKIIDTKRSTDPKVGGYLVESVDVEVSMDGFQKANGRADEKIRVRIPVPTPKPYAPKVLFRLAGTSGAFQELTNGNQLANGRYEFKGRGSGIMIGAIMTVDGIDYKLGHKSDGSITHDARSYDAKNIDMPEVVNHSFEDKQEFGKGGDACKAETFNATHSVQLTLLSLDGESDVKTPEYKMVAKGKESGLSVNDYETMCAAPGQCPYVGGEYYPDGGVDGSALGYYWIDIHGGAKIDDIAGLWNHQQAQEMNLTDRKLCTRITPGKAKPEDPEWMKTTEFITYQAPACQPRFLTQRSACGCVAEDTLITMGDGKTQKRIDELQASDRIWNPITKEAVSMRRVSRGPEPIPMLKISVGDKVLSVTGNHPFPTRTGMKTAFTLNDGEEIMLEGDTWQKIAKIDAVPPTDKPPVVWNIEIDAPNDNWDAHHYVANGVVTGDLLIQMQLESAKRTASNE